MINKDVSVKFQILKIISITASKKNGARECIVEDEHGKNNLKQAEIQEIIEDMEAFTRFVRSNDLIHFIKDTGF